MQINQRSKWIQVEKETFFDNSPNMIVSSSRMRVCRMLSRLSGSSLVMKFCNMGRTSTPFLKGNLKVLLVLASDGAGGGDGAAADGESARLLTVAQVKQGR